MNDMTKKPRAKSKPRKPRTIESMQPTSRGDELDADVLDVRALGQELGCSAAWASMQVKRIMTKLAATTIREIRGDDPTLKEAQHLAVTPEFQNLVIELLKEKDASH